MLHNADLDLAAQDISALTSAEAVAAFFTKLGYDTGKLRSLTPNSIGLSGDAATPIKQIELLSEDGGRELRVVFVRLRSLTAKARTDLARVLSKSIVDHLLVLASDFSVLEFALLDKRKGKRRDRIQVIPVTVAVDRRAPTRVQLRLLRRMTWTCRDGLEQYDKLRCTFEAAAFTEKYFQNRALFADHYLETRLRDDPAWRENPTEVFSKVKDLYQDAPHKWFGKDEQIVREELYGPLFKLLGFKAVERKSAKSDASKPDFILQTDKGKPLTAAFVYRWDRWLDGPDFQDPATPEENPGAGVVTALDEGVADWLIVTNGRLWRLYSRQAHSRATNFYEADLVEALAASGDTDPNEAFRYWWLFFRTEAFQPAPEAKGCWLDAIVSGSREYAKRLGERLKERVFETIFPHLARGFLVDRKKRLRITKRPTEEELHEIHEAALTLLYRLLFLLYAESRDLLPIREGPYGEASLRKIKDEIAEKAGAAEDAVPERLRKEYSDQDSSLYDRLFRLFKVVDAGDQSLNVPTYNGGLFITKPDKKSDRRDQRIARFLTEHKVPDRFLALAIDRLARAPDDKTLGLVFIDYKSLGVRHLGSIYEGLLEFKLKIAPEDLATRKDKKAEKYVPLTQVKKKKRGKAAQVIVRKGEVYLSNDKAERKASGSYYTPDPIVRYIVEHTVGPVLEEKLEALRPEFRKVRKTFDRLKQNAMAQPVRGATGEKDPRQYAREATYNAHKDLVDRLFDFKVLDPAMGSAHFLVEAVDFLTDRIIRFLNQFPVNPVTHALERTRQNILESLGGQGVTVDADKLTDVNLLKRHVLKRCIYGVDLNPMAVELAKVSLWLDAFTLGAPLSFLDHHLRRGNSLIGASFKDLEEATKDQLFGINYEPLKRAIGRVLLVGRMTDATASEVQKSRSEYDRARKELSGYQVLLDLLVAKHFGFPKAPDVLALGSELDTETRERFLASIRDPKRRRMVEQIEALARRPNLRFFHWDIEFPEVFFGYKTGFKQAIEHRDKIEPGSAGFDAVVGNPPYVRQEGLKELKPYLKAAHEPVYAGVADLYVYFYHRGLGKLSTGGRFGMITANKFMRAGYGEKLRRYLAQHSIHDLIDFRDLPIFPDATAYPLVCIAEHGTPGQEHSLRTYSVNDMDEANRIGEIMARQSPSVTLASLRPDGWTLQRPEVLRLLEKIRAAGRPLEEVIDGKFYYGIKTGYNEAFVIDKAKRRELIAADPKSEEIIKPFLRGKDIKRWRVEWAGWYLIFIPWHFPFHGDSSISGASVEAECAFQKQFPAVYEHILRFKANLLARNKEETGIRYEWYALQRCAATYYAEFEKPKIVYQVIATYQQFAFTRESYLSNDKTWIILSDDPALLAALNSKVAWWFLDQTTAKLQGGAFELRSTYVGQIPIPQMNGAIKQTLTEHVRAVSESPQDTEAVAEHERDIDKIVYRLYGLTEDEIALVEGRES